jgi:hypothetical protein
VNPKAAPPNTTAATIPPITIFFIRTFSNT